MKNPQHYSTHEINRALQFQPSEQRDIALELRDMILTEAPHATERILAGGLSYHNAEEGGPVKGSICGISFHEDHVRLSFIHGSFLDDPLKLLEAEGKRMYKRFVRIESYNEVPWDALRELIRRAVEFSPSSLG